MRKIVSLLLVAAIGAALVGCSSGPSDPMNENVKPPAPPPRPGAAGQR